LKPDLPEGVGEYKPGVYVSMQTKPRPMPNMSTDNGGPIMVDGTAVTGPLTDGERCGEEVEDMITKS